MTRDEGFTHADLSTGFLRDPKIKRLKAAAGYEGIVAYLDVVLSSWEAGDRYSAADVGISEENAAQMARLGLLDEDGMIPLPVWAAWFGKAWKRRDDLRRKWKSDKARQRGDDDVVSTAESTVESTATDTPVQTLQNRPEKTGGTGGNGKGDHELPPEQYNAVVTAAMEKRSKR